MKKLFNNHDKNGFTLVELLVSLLISGILIFTVMTVFLMSQKLYIHGEGISYKQKSITNVETELQNSLAKAIEVRVDQTAGGDYSIGFNGAGDCNIDPGGYVSDQVKDIQLEIVGDTMSYKLIPKNSAMSTLSGGIVLNNFDHPDFDHDGFVNGSLKTNLPKYLVVTFAAP
ncbi:PilW family protein [Acetobacterium wieringae]|uniref:PilW family protein n=1 Tax=Acetobacterium wieringae TaxID=52694 RepID=UPI0026F2A66F|nr:prepilin-type N-terminal cleavage/methylation domain-containing protein [Acetobacterium wieringae]